MKFNLIGAIGLSLLTFGMSFVGMFVGGEIAARLVDVYSPIEAALLGAALCIFVGGLIVLIFTQAGWTKMMGSAYLPIAPENENEEERWFP